MRKHEYKAWEPIEVTNNDDPVALENMPLKKYLQIKTDESGQKDNP